MGMILLGRPTTMAATAQSLLIIVCSISFSFSSVGGFQHQPPIAFTTQRHSLHPTPLPSNVLLFSSTHANDSKPQKKKRSSNKRYSRNRTKNKIGAVVDKKVLKNPNYLTWRCYGIDVLPDDLGPLPNIDKRRRKKQDGSTIPSKRSYLTPPVVSSLLSRLRIKAEESDHILKDARVVRRSLDARRRKGSDPKYTYVIDIDVTRETARNLGLTQQPGRMEIIDDNSKSKSQNNEDINAEVTKSKPRIVIVGAGPAGLFCALSLASSGLCTPILLERGQPVEARGKSIGALIHRRCVDPESNFSFGEGGAGTWSDGKLTTRIGRNSGKYEFHRVYYACN